MSAQITINVAGDERSVDQGTTAADLFEGDRAVLVARVNGELRDLAGREAEELAQDRRRRWTNGSRTGPAAG